MPPLDLEALSLLMVCAQLLQEARMFFFYFSSYFWDYMFSRLFCAWTYQPQRLTIPNRTHDSSSTLFGLLLVLMVFCLLKVMVPPFSPHVLALLSPANLASPVSLILTVDLLWPLPSFLLLEPSFHTQTDEKYYKYYKLIIFFKCSALRPYII